MSRASIPQRKKREIAIFPLTIPDAAYRILSQNRGGLKFY